MQKEKKKEEQKEDTLCTIYICMYAYIRAYVIKKQSSPSI